MGADCKNPQLDEDDEKRIKFGFEWERGDLDLYGRSCAFL